MEKYIKPKIDIVSIGAIEDIAGLVDCLESEGAEYKYAGIVVYDALS